jgi:hypothetical protein
MKHFNRFTRIAALLVLAAMALAGCASGTGEQTTADAETAPAPEVEFVIAENGKSPCKIVMPEHYGNGEGAAAVKLFMALGAGSYTGLKLVDDFMTEGTSEDPDAVEIVIGPTNRALSAEIEPLLRAPKDYVIAVSGKKLGIYSGSEAGFMRAVEYLSSKLTEKDGRAVLTLPESVYDVFVYPAENFTIGGRPLSDFVIVVPDGSDENMKLAARVNDWVMDSAGCTLPVNTASSPAADCEIQIGKTGRQESLAYYSGAAALAKNEYAVQVTGTKVLAAYTVYSASAVDALMALLEPCASLTDTLVRKTDDAYTVFRYNNYAAGRLSDALLDSVNPGVLALLSCCMYYEDQLQAGIARGEKWVYSNNSKYVPQNGTFDTMVRSKKCGGNCAMGQGWVLIDLGLSSGAHMYGNSSGGISNLSSVGKYAACVGTFYSWDNGAHTFDQLFRRGRVMPGDIFFCNLHTFIYLGDDLFFAVGHDSKWHTDTSAPTEDSRHAVFDSWLNSRSTCHDSSYAINYSYRFRDDYVPRCYRDSAGKLVANPLWSADVSIEYKDGVSSDTVTFVKGEY